jgi:hypothetical protein
MTDAAPMPPLGPYDEPHAPSYRRRYCALIENSRSTAFGPTRKENAMESEDPFENERRGANAGLNPMFGDWQHRFRFAPVPYADEC